MDRIETATCSRCGGTGSYSYCTGYGTMCFKCSGRKVVLSKRGAVANAFLIRLRQRMASELRVGMLLFMEPGPFNKGGFKLILKMSDGPVESGCSYMKDGAWVKQLGIAIDCEGFATNLPPDKLERVGHTAAGKAQTLRLALEYQDRLTKAGKLAKGQTFKSPEQILAEFDTTGWIVRQSAQDAPRIVAAAPEGQGSQI